MIELWVQQYRKTNWAIRTGPETGVFVVDVDGDEGVATLAAHENKYVRLPTTLTQTTGSGGSHYIFSYPAGRKVPNSVRKKLGPGLDVRSDNGYIVIPPSNHYSGGLYSWKNDIHVAEAPQWLLDLVCTEPVDSITEKEEIGEITPEKRSYAEAALVAEVKTVSEAPEGTRNDTLNISAVKMGGYVASGLLTEEAVRDALTVAGEAAGLRQPEIQKTINSGLNAGLKTPKAVPDQAGFEECIKLAEALTVLGQPSEITNILEVAVKANLNNLEQERLLSTIKRRTKVSIGVLRNEYQTAYKNSNVTASLDIGMDVVSEALRRYYNGGSHLIRAIDKSFWRYTGTHWQRLTDEQVKCKLLEVISETVNPDDLTFSAALFASFNLICACQAASGDVLRLAEEPPPVINCRNGELWVASDGSVELRSHSHDSYLTYVLNVDYEPDATSPLFDQTLLGIFGKSSDPADMARHLLEMIGYAIQPRRDIACYFMLQGSGNNGKSKVVETIEKIISQKAIHSSKLSEIEGHKFAIGSLAGKLILLDDDVDTGTRLPDGLLKKLSERKLLTGELKFKDSFEFVATCLPILLANNFPVCADLSYGLRRRVKIIPFARKFEPHEDDRGLFPRIWQAELPGILNRAIEGLRRLRRRGDFFEPEECLKAKDEWLAHANPLVAFINEGTEPDHGKPLPLRDFYAEFISWAESSGIRNISTRNTVRANLINLGYKVEHTRYCSSAVFGLKLKTPASY